MDNILIVIGNKERAELFEANRASSKLIKIDCIENPNARKKEQDLVTDAPGRVMKDNGTGSRSVGIEGGAVEQSLHSYAGDILSHVQNLQVQNQDKKVMLVSEPGFLGILKKHFKTAKVDVLKTIPKELNHLDERGLFLKLRDNIRYF